MSAAADYMSCHIRVYVYTCRYVCMNEGMYVGIRIYLYVHVHIHVYAVAGVRQYVDVHVYAYVCVHI